MSKQKVQENYNVKCFQEEMIQQMAMELKMKRENKKRATWLWRKWLAEKSMVSCILYNKVAFWNTFVKSWNACFHKVWHCRTICFVFPPFPYNGWTFQLKQFTSRNFQTIRPTFKIEPDFFSQISSPVFYMVKIPQHQYT